MGLNEILAVRQKPFSDDTISQKEYHSYSPYSFKPNYEIRITIQNQDLYVLPLESLLNFQGDITLIKEGGAAETQNVIGRMRNNCMAYFFDEIRYEINGVEIDRTRLSGLLLQ